MSTFKPVTISMASIETHRQYLDASREVIDIENRINSSVGKDTAPLKEHHARLLRVIKVLEQFIP